MKVGIILPQFVESPQLAVEVALCAENAGIDGVFAFDHLFRSDSSELYAQSMFPILGAVASCTNSVSVGSLVARVGIVKTAVLINEFNTLRDVCKDRLIAGLGVGDAKSRVENDVYGIETLSIDVRMQLLEETASALKEAGIATWLGGNSERVRALAQHLDVVSNFWLPLQAEIPNQPTEVTWAGMADAEAETLKAQLRWLGTSSCSWAVFLLKGISEDYEGVIYTLMQAKNDL